MIEAKAALAGADAERMEIVQAAKMKANSEYDCTIAEARAEADKIVSSARETAMLEQEQAKAALSEEIVELAIHAASKVAEENMDSDKTAGWCLTS